MFRNKNYTDEELLVNFYNGNEAAFEIIFNKYFELLLLYAYKKLKDKEECQDVVQDVFVKLYKNRENLLNVENLSSYLHKSVLNSVYDIYKHSFVVNKHAEQNNKEGIVNNTDFLIREKEAKIIIEDVISKMPEKMREIFVLKKIHHLTTRQIAEKLGLSELTVSTQLKRAAKLFKSSIKEFMVLIFILINK